ncbi:hypothetical protein RCOM_1115840 [Ricinus communis]|uniref:RNase H type-1 domain-containing protein n=1 Tax=Ricinus communis TaxID=3988 RepID=B9SH42_RICCO|nr:hypothetical protein RCOM_1115840 [Ricinus communis]
MVLIVVHRLQTGAGDIVRDRCGNGDTGFGMNIDSCSISEAELWGLYQQLRIAWNRGVVQLEVELTAGLYHPPVVESRVASSLEEKQMVETLHTVL